MLLTATVTTGSLPFSSTWDFGDDSPLVSETALVSPFFVSYTYSAVGIYGVTLTIIDSDEMVLTGTTEVEVACYPLTITLTNSGITQAGLPVLFTATLTGGETPYSHTWDFGDQSPTEIGTTTSITISALHRYGAGSYIATLAVTDVHGCSAPPAQTTVAIAETERHLPVVLKAYRPPPATPIPPVVNGGFEAGGLYGWDSGGLLPTSVVSEVVSGNVYSGTWNALLGSPDYGDGGAGNVPVGSGWISQQITVPVGFTGTLSLAYRMQGYDGLGNDRFRACVVDVDTSQQVCFVNESFSGYAGLFKDTGWQPASYAIPPGWRTVKIYLEHINETDSYWNTWTYADEVRVSLEQ